MRADRWDERTGDDADLTLDVDVPIWRSGVALRRALLYCIATYGLGVFAIFIAGGGHGWMLPGHLWLAATMPFSGLVLLFQYSVEYEYAAVALVGFLLAPLMNAVLCMLALDMVRRYRTRNTSRHA